MAETEVVESEPEGHGESEDNRASPTVIANPALRFEAKRALVWVLVVGLTILAVYISQALLVIFGAMVFAAMLDAGSQISREAAQLPEIVTLQSARLIAWLDDQGFTIDPSDVQGLAGQALSGV